MLGKVYRASALAVLGSLYLVAATPVWAQPDAQDETFAQLRDAAKKNDAAKAEALAMQLSSYPLQSYVEYFRLKPRLYDRAGNPRPDAPDAEVQAFLNKYQGEAIADRLRNDWLLVLGKRKDWVGVEAEYPKFVLDDDTQVKCYALQAKLQRGVHVADEARAAMQDAKYFGEACPELIGALVQRGQFTRLDADAYGHWALEQNLGSLARRIGYGDSDAVATATRMARTDPNGAIRYFQGVEGSLSAPEKGAGWGVIGQFLAKNLSPEAAQAYRRQADLGGDALLSPESHEWKVRAALRAGDWKLVRQAVEAMPRALRSKDPAWNYWYGRALQVEGRAAEAQQQFQALAGQYNFYGQLALEELGQKISVPKTTLFTENDVAAMSQKAGFARAQKFYEMNQRFEGNREWNWELRSLNDKQLIAAAEHGRRIQLLDRTVNSADKTRAEHDFGLRFLMPYQDIMQRHTQQIGLDTAWAYGLVRQESRFIMSARSHVGASGLMQVMPATAKFVARKIGLQDFHPAHMNDINTNIQLGANYLKMVLDDLNGSWTLATAAYNAGPGRPKAWRSSLNRKVEGAIFAETIPFAETRGYVKNVLSNATYYAALMSATPQSLKARLGEVSPRRAEQSELP